MIDIRIALRAILLADPAINAAVGGSRIYPQVLPQGQKLQSIVQNLITEDIGYHMKGDMGLMIARTQLDAWAQQSDPAVALGNLVFDRLSGFRDTAFSYTVNGVPTTVDIVTFHAQGQDDYDTTAQMYSRRRDFFVWYRVR